MVRGDDQQPAVLADQFAPASLLPRLRDPLGMANPDLCQIQPTL
jgi:hypothetical protein